MTTKIEWTDETWNPVTGCSKVSQGCAHCYAERVSKRFGFDFNTVTLHPDRLDQPLHWKKPRLVFVNSMSDLFHEEVPFEFIVRTFAAMAITPRHTYQILTKRPDRAQKFFDIIAGMDESPGDVLADDAYRDLGEEADCWIANYVNGYSMPTEIPHDGNPCDGTIPRWPLPNVWLGVSVEDQSTADERIPLLLQTPAAVRFVSYEPMLGPVDLSPWLAKLKTMLEYLQGVGKDHIGAGDSLDWVICGGESGPGARPMHPDWARAVRDQCQAAGVPFFFKQWGEWLPVNYGAPLCGSTIKMLRVDGSYTARQKLLPTDTEIVCVGTKRAGRLLDGREWNEMPEAAEVEG